MNLPGVLQRFAGDLSREDQSTPKIFRFP